MSFYFNRDALAKALETIPDADLLGIETQMHPERVLITMRGASELAIWQCLKDHGLKTDVEDGPRLAAPGQTQLYATGYTGSGTGKDCITIARFVDRSSITLHDPGIEETTTEDSQPDL